MAKVLHRLKRYGESERILQELLQSPIKTDVVVVELHLWLAKVLVAMGKEESAKALLLGIIKEDARYQDSKQLNLALTRLLEGQGQWEESTNHLERVMAFDPADPDVLASLAANYFYSEQPELAVMCYERLLDLGHCTASIWNNYALSKFYSGDFDQVYECFEEAIGAAVQDTEHADLWFNISQVAVCCGDLEWARSCLQLATHYEPGHAESLNNMGVMGDDGGLSDCRRLFEQSCKKGSGLFEPFYNLAMLERSEGRLESALANARKAHSNYPMHRGCQSMIEGLLSEINEF